MTIQPCADLLARDVSVFAGGSCWIPGSYLTSNSMSAPSNALPHFQGVMMSCKDGVGQIIKTCVTVGTLIALACRFCVIKAAHDGLFGLARWTFDTLRPA